jgi:hypothetical protein
MNYSQWVEIYRAQARRPLMRLTISKDTSLDGSRTWRLPRIPACSWCGETNGWGGLFRYGYYGPVWPSQDASGKIYELHGAYCSVVCMREVHSY